MSKSATTMKYEGSVNVTVKVRGKTFTVKGHNEGLPSLQRLFAKAVSGNPLDSTDIPRYLDIKKLQEGSSVSILRTPIVLTGRQFLEDDTLVWKAVLTSVITSSSLISAVSSSDTSDFKIYLINGEREFARLPVEAETLSRIGPGSEAIVEWTLSIKNV